jgi:gliding motility-associated-like protein
LNRYLSISLFCLFCLIFRAQSQGVIEFVENKGQWDSRVKYRGLLNSGSFFIRNGGFTIVQHNDADIQRLSDWVHGIPSLPANQARNGNVTINSHAWNVDFIDANPQMQVVADKEQSTYNNYFIGNDPNKWAANCKIYQAVTLKNVYPNVDVRYYTDNGSLKYDIIAKPGANISKIALRYTGVDKLELQNRELYTSTSLGKMKESAPYTYQFKSGGKAEVSCKYVVKDNVVRFDLRNYDPSATVIIDPQLVFCSFSGSSTDNWGFTATYGPDGSFFGGGIAFESQTGSFPTSPGAYQTVFQGGNGTEPIGAIDIAIIKLSPDGRNRMYATYLGGNGNEQPHSLVVDGQSNLIIAGRSSSANFPVTGGAAGLIGAGGNYDIVVTKLNAAGNNLIGSKRIGGTSDDGVNITTNRQNGTTSLMRNYGDDGRSEVILDGAGNIYVASSTRSSNFPIQGGGFQPTFGGGGQDAVVLKFNNTVSSLLFSSFLGGSGEDAGYVLSLAQNGNIYVAGGTSSTDFPGNTAGSVGPANHGPANTPIDGYVTIISNNGATQLRSTYIGTSGIDQVYGVQFDRFGFPYIMGQTTGAFPVQNATFSNPGGKQFIAKLQPDLSSYVYSTVFGTGSSTPNISPIAFLVDRCQNVYVSGWGGHFFDSNNFNSAGTTGLPITPDAIKSTTDGRDFYFFVLKKDAAAQLFGSFWGENNNLQTNPGSDHVDGGTSRFDQNGVIYQAICGNCRLTQPVIPYPTTPGAWSTTNNTTPSSGGGCNLTMVKIAMNLAGVDAQVLSAISGVPRDTAGCVPLTVDFTDSVRNAVWYEWNFGDGTPTVGPLPAATGFTQSHTYNSTGTFQVMLIAIDSTTCNIRDTSYIHIRVGDLRATLNFQPVKLNPCDSFKYRFDNLSVAPPSKPFGPRSFVWDYGDGSPRDTTGPGSVFHNYPAPGTYNVILQLIDTSYCNSPDADTIQLRVSAIVDAIFSTSPTGCVPYTASFQNNSVGGLSFQWFFGDGGTSTAVNPTYTYNTAGTYNVVMIATDPNTCNVTDTARFTINVFNNPIASFNYSPQAVIENTAHTFTNQSSADAVRFRWDFGDGDTLLTTSRLPVVHQYNATGTFNACLRAYNAAGCFDDTCQQVTTLIIPLVDVPNAFTPQSTDANNIVYVKGFGISKMRFIIWNRWGQKVFETGNRFQGWDGKYKGTVQPMDVYAYTLEVEFFDGTKTTKKGDITLIR